MPSLHEKMQRRIAANKGHQKAARKMLRPAAVRNWSERHDKRFADAVAAIAEDMNNNDTSFEGSLEHYAALFEIAPEALRHEWNLRVASGEV